MSRSLINPHYRHQFRTPAPESGLLEFHRTLPGYAPTRLRPLTALARQSGVQSLHLKDESDRFGLPAYKVVGAAWAACRLLRQRFDAPAAAFDWLRDRLRLEPITLVTATEGNHGRGVARVARWLGIPAEIHLPAGTARSRVDAIAGEGAVVVEVVGSYDDAVASAARRADGNRILLQDQGWPGYEEIPGWIADGYDTILAEAEMQLAEQGVGPPDLVLVQIGVGTLASAVVRHFRAEGRTSYPVLVGAEPVGADCALRSIEAGEPISFDAGAHASIMAGLNCGTPSSAAWPLMRDGMQGFVAIDDARAREAMRALAAEEVRAGASGSAGTGALMELMRPEHAATRAQLGIGPTSRVLAISTEGVTDPVLWQEVMAAR
jgi:diaminopropionate ammonia-lyase